MYDIIGNEITTLVEEFKQAGKYEVEFNASSTIRNLASGIYFYQLRIRGSEINSEQTYRPNKKDDLFKVKTGNIKYEYCT